MKYIVSFLMLSTITIDYMKKKISYTLAFIIALAIWAFIMGVLGGCSQYTCPTYSQTPTTNHTIGCE